MESPPKIKLEGSPPKTSGTRFERPTKLEIWGVTPQNNFGG